MNERRDFYMYTYVGLTANLPEKNSSMDYIVKSTCTKSRFSSSITSWEKVSKNRSCELLLCAVTGEAPISPPPPSLLDDGLEGG